MHIKKMHIKKNAYKKYAKKKMKKNAYKNTKINQDDRVQKKNNRWLILCNCFRTTKFSEKFGKIKKRLPKWSKSIVTDFCQSKILSLLKKL